MKSLAATSLLAATAVIQALAIFRYSSDSMVFSGQTFFAILFALMALYLGWRQRLEERRSPAALALLMLALLLLGLTLAGMAASIYYFYPSSLLVYLALGLQVVNLALLILWAPRRPEGKKPEGLSRRVTGRRRGPERSHQLVAVVKQDEPQQEGKEN